MNIYFDTEFTGLHKGTNLISIGLISDDDRTFYAEFVDYDKTQCNDWINENVIKNLKFKLPEQNEDYYYVATRDKRNTKGNDLYNGYSVEMQGTKEMIMNELIMWFNQFNTVELVSDVCHYDMVLLIDIFGTAFDLPNNVSASCYDINQDIAKYLNVSQSKAFDKSREEFLFEESGYELQECKHNSLYDAKVIKLIYSLINKY